MCFDNTYILMSKPSIVPKTTRSQTLKEAALKKKKDDKISQSVDYHLAQHVTVLCTIGADKLLYGSPSSRRKQKTAFDDIFVEDTGVDSIDFATSSTAHRTFAEPPSNDGISEESVVLSRLNITYYDDKGRSVYCLHSLCR